MSDKRRDIHTCNTPAVLRPQLDGTFLCDDKFPAVTAYMIIDAVLYCLKDRRFAMISPAHKQCDAFPDPHAAHFSAVRKRKRHAQRFRRHERHRSGKRLIRYAALPRQDRPVRNKRTKSALRKLPPDILLILAERDRRTKCFLVYVCII